VEQGEARHTQAAAERTCIRSTPDPLDDLEA